MEDQKETDARELVEKIRDVDIIMHRKLFRELKFTERPGTLMLIAKLRRSEKSNPEGLRVSELASAFNITASGVTQLVTGLEERGYVGRSMDKEDRRAVRVFLTAEGMALADSMQRSIDALFEGLVDYLGPQKSHEFLSILSEVCQYFDRIKAANTTTTEGKAE